MVESSSALGQTQLNSTAHSTPGLCSYLLSLFFFEQSLILWQLQSWQWHIKINVHCGLEMLTFLFLFRVVVSEIIYPDPPLSCLTCLWFHLHFASKHTQYALLALPDLAQTTHCNNHIFDLELSCLVYFYFICFVLSLAAHSHSLVFYDTTVYDVYAAFVYTHPPHPLSV